MRRMRLAALLQDFTTMADESTTDGVSLAEDTLLALTDANSLYLKGDGGGFVVGGKHLGFPKGPDGAFAGGTIATSGTTVAGAGDGLSLDSATRVASVKVKDGEKVVFVTADGVSSELSLKWDKTSKKICILGRGDAEISSIDATDFVKDGMLKDVKLETEGTAEYMVFTWNTDAGDKTLKVDVSRFVDVYTAGDGLALEGGEFSADWNKVASVAGYISKDDAAKTYVTQGFAGDTYATKSLSGESVDWSAVSLEDVCGLVHDIAKEMGANVSYGAETAVSAARSSVSDIGLSAASAGPSAPETVGADRLDDISDAPASTAFVHALIEKCLREFAAKGTTES